MSEQKEPSKSRMQPRIIFRRILFFGGTFAILLVVIVGLFYLLRGQKMPEWMIDTVKNLVIGIGIGAGVALVDHRLLEKREEKRIIRFQVLNIGYPLGGQMTVHPLNITGDVLEVGVGEVVH